ncbi:flagellar transcriptional regulator FlhC [Salmonella enterica]|nr:flagellar transcriptional regulator FlhC [Salmonella enterica]EJK8997838.1 flagellar transcriptional regulator FlhC [Salmonella enterica]
MASESLLQELEDIQLAVELISLGARMQLLEHTVSLSRGKMTRLYKEVRGTPPPKGMLPFSADWFMIWENNVHSSLFCNIFDCIKAQVLDESSVKILVQAYRAYLKYAGNTETLSLTRAWILRRFVDSGILSYTPCCQCGGKFITHVGEPAYGYQCVMCHPPSRAIKKRFYRISDSTSAKSKLPIFQAANR